MKICIVANGYPSIKDPQRGCFELDQALALKKYGHSVDVLYVDGSFRLYWRKIGITNYIHDGINIFGLFIFPLKLLKILLPLKTFVKLRQSLFLYLFKKVYKHHKQPDILYSHYLYNTAYVLKIIKRYDIPLVGIEHWSEINRPQLSNNVKYLGDIAYSKVDKLIAVSESLSLAIKKHFGKKSLVVNNMVGKDFLDQSINLEQQTDSFFKFVAIGSLIARKGFDLLIDAFNKANLKEKKCKLIIIGGGKEQDCLQQQIELLSLADSVTLVGRKNKQEIISYLQKSDVFVLSSHVETFSVVCIEAMALGIPIIATSCGGPEEFVTEEVGLLVKPGDVNALSQAMNEMYNNYHNYDRENIHNICKCKFAPEVIAQQLSSIFEEVVIKHQSQK